MAGRLHECQIYGAVSPSVEARDPVECASDGRRLLYVSTPDAVEKRRAISTSATSQVKDARAMWAAAGAVVAMTVTLGAARRPGLLGS